METLERGLEWLKSYRSGDFPGESLGVSLNWASASGGAKDARLLLAETVLATWGRIHDDTVQRVEKELSDLRNKYDIT